MAVTSSAVYVRPSLSSAWLPHPVPWPAVAPVHAAITTGDGSVIVATGGGLYMLDRVTLRWQDLGAALPSDAPIYSLATDGSTIYAGGDSTVWQRDSQGGWQATGDGLPTGADVHALVVLPGPPRRLLCATDYGLYATYAGSEHWTIVAGPFAGHAVGALIYAPTTATVYAAAVQGGVYAAAASTLHWHPLPGSFQLGVVHVLAASSDGTWLLANDRKTTDGGHQWQPTGLTGTLTAIEVAQTPSVMLAGTAASGLYRSLDRGTTWMHVKGIPATANVPELTLADVAGASLVYVIANGQILVSADAGSTWRLIAPAPPRTLITSVIAQGSTPVQVLAGATSGGVFLLSVRVSFPVPSATTSPAPSPSPAATGTATAGTITPTASRPPASATPTERPTAGVPATIGTLTRTPSPTASPRPTPTLGAPTASPTWTATAGPVIR